MVLIIQVHVDLVVVVVVVVVIAVVFVVVGSWRNCEVVFFQKGKGGFFPEVSD